MKITNANRRLMCFATQRFVLRNLTARVSHCLSFKAFNQVQDTLVFAGTSSHFAIDTIESNKC